MKRAPRDVTPVSAYRAWLKLCAEFPDLRSDLDQKSEYFVCWEIAHGMTPNAPAGREG